jgi:hypothetical protein
MLLRVLFSACRPLLGIYRQLREASKRQFTKSRPGHLAVLQFQDLTADEMEGLARDGASGTGNPIGLNIMTSAFLQSPNRTHIHSVAYRSHGTVVRPESHPHAWMESGVGSLFRGVSTAVQPTKVCSRPTAKRSASVVATDLRAHLCGCTSLRPASVTLTTKGLSNRISG